MKGLIAAAALAVVAMPAFAQTRPASPPPAPAVGTPDPVGGYAPPQQPPAGPNSVFVQAPPPEVAFPPPPPLASYPPCKKGQTDDCIQRGDPK